MKNMIKYSFVQGFFWMLFCSCYGYITFYLEHQGFSTGQIGIITAGFGICGALLQPVLGRIADKGLISWKKLTMLVLSGNLISGILIPLIGIKVLQGILFGVTLICTNSIMPLINRAGFACESETEKINFGVARGIGSLSYAILSLFLGRLTLQVSENCVPFSIAVVAFLLEIAIFTMPEGSSRKISEVSVQNLSEKTSIAGIIKKYPEFFIIWFACVLQMTFHNLANTYLIQICTQAGGNSGTLGIALAISAVLELPVMFCFSLIHKKISSKTLLLVSGIAFVVKGILYILSKNIGILYLAQTVQSVSFAVYASASVYYAEEAVDDSCKTTAQAFMSNSQTIGSVIGCLAGGILIEKMNLQFALITGTFIACAAVLITVPVIIKSKIQVK